MPLVLSVLDIPRPTGSTLEANPLVSHTDFEGSIVLVFTLCYAIVLPGRKTGFRAGFRPDYCRERLKICPPAGRRADFDVFPD